MHSLAGRSHRRHFLGPSPSSSRPIGATVVSAGQPLEPGRVHSRFAPLAAAEYGLSSTAAPARTMTSRSIKRPRGWVSSIWQVRRLVSSGSIFTRKNPSNPVSRSRSSSYSTLKAARTASTPAQAITKEASFLFTGPGGCTVKEISERPGLASSSSRCIATLASRLFSISSRVITTTQMSRCSPP